MYLLLHFTEFSLFRHLVTSKIPKTHLYSDNKHHHDYNKYDNTNKQTWIHNLRTRESRAYHPNVKINNVVIVVDTLKACHIGHFFAVLKAFVVDCQRNVKYSGCESAIQCRTTTRDDLIGNVDYLGDRETMDN